MENPMVLSNEIRQSVSLSLARVRKSRGLSLSGLAEASGIGKATLSGIEAGRGNPTIETVWRLAHALGVPFGELISQEQDQLVESSSTGVSVRLINKQSSPFVIETYVMDMAPHTKRTAEAHMPGVEENVVVLKGRALTGSQAEPVFLTAGKSCSFAADIPHLYQSLDEQTSMMVSVIYPTLAEAAPGEHDIHREWPRSEDDWSGLQQQFRRLALESRQGVSAVRLSFTDCEDPLGAEQQLLQNLQPEAPGMQTFYVNEQGPKLICLSREGSHALLDEEPLDNSRLQQALELSNLAVSPWRQLDEADRAGLQTLVQSDSICLSSLAAEVLTRNGSPCVPLRAAPRYEVTPVVQRESDNVLFEDRIDVDGYAAWELVHPAYAKQSVAIAQQLHHYLAPGATRIIDIGTGPGLPLKMLLELLPELQVTTVDPSETAFNHLQKLFRHSPNVHSCKTSITDLPAPERPFDAAISVGASHHLDTLAFLSATRRQLSRDGIFVVSDEMISPFSTIRQRKIGLMQHHLQYIADTLVPISLTDLPQEEHRLVHMLRQDVPQALFEALSGDESRSEYRCRRLLERLHALTLSEQPADPLQVFYRFHILELEALVAGLDYEVEQKTSPDCFSDLARAAGFSVQHHCRLYATCGRTDRDAGTHLFVLQAL
ncbi:helix-turn-helix domain-containing protein [Erwinia endophytica]|uniref:helix-turn-helix domain-containing protein n=1 Tax=Erwinia endophytica TaxID=1563158 RepID=UPI001265E4E5|nr:helix-turn-helix domain-containing protein [Erwinia endophytica]KAB8310555.1 helix-turn-helix domain-containing protein [Erwinia endophytica]